MLGAIALVVLAGAFFALVGFGSKQAKETALAGMWVALAVATAVSVIAGLLK